MAQTVIGSVVKTPASDKLDRCHKKKEPHSGGEEGQAFEGYPGQNGSTRSQPQVDRYPKHGQQYDARQSHGHPALHVLEFLFRRLKSSGAAVHTKVIISATYLAADGVVLVNYHATNRVHRCIAALFFDPCTSCHHHRRGIGTFLTKI